MYGLRYSYEKYIKNIRKKNRISYVTDDEYEYCRYCEANLTLQKGYSNDLPYWVCKGCGQMLINPNLNTDSDIIWTCDGCETLLNKQPGFTEKMVAGNVLHVDL